MYLKMEEVIFLQNTGNHVQDYTAHNPKDQNPRFHHSLSHK
jgi:hypothetical protein